MRKTRLVKVTSLRGTGSKTCKGRIYLIRYLDHALFVNSDPKLYEPPVMEAVGWLDVETSEYIRICHERREPLPGERTPKLTGLVILKKAIVEKRELKCAT